MYLFVEILKCKLNSVISFIHQEYNEIKLNLFVMIEIKNSSPEEVKKTTRGITSYVYTHAHTCMYV